MPLGTYTQSLSLHERTSHVSGSRNCRTGRAAWDTSENVIVQLNVYKEEKDEDKKQLKIWSVRRRRPFAFSKGAR
jgi:hypothetical protein